MADLLLELFSEEIPARMQEEATQHLCHSLVNKLGVPFPSPPVTIESVGYWSTPRRIAAIVRHIPTTQADVSSELKGPRVGAPDAALQGFLKKNNLKKEDLVERDGIYFAEVHHQGKPVAELLKAIIEETLTQFPWPKSMRWGAGDVTWVRPLHSILCLFDGKVIPVTFGGIIAGDVTYGHRFMNPAPITITDPMQYEDALEKAHVLVRRSRRKADILKQAEQAAATKGLTLKKDEALLEEVTGLVEWPVLLMGRIDADFMDLPPEVLTTVMRSHQKYFALQDAQGTLSPYFLIAANMQTQDGGAAIVAGNERVLRARFSDARFFWDQDRKLSLDEWAKGLASVTFHAKLGTVADKVEHIALLAVQLFPYVGHIGSCNEKEIERAARLCKADLVTGMVGEFAELQGIMGRYYALQQDESSAIADAIRDHYKPQGPNDSVPKQPVSICVALADKFDTLMSMFGIGEKPTGSKDPFALRRAALGIVRIILDNAISLPLLLFLKSMKGLPYGKGSLSATYDPDALFAFFIDRLKAQLKDQGIRHDVINAVVAGGDDDLLRIVARAKTLQDFLASEDGVNLLAGYRRAANIVAIEEKKDKATYKAEIDPALLREPEEIDIFNRLTDTASQLEGLREQQQFGKVLQFDKALTLLAGLRRPVDAFFDKIMVNCDDAQLRMNRLRLLSYIRATMDNIAHFSLIEG